jgi:hypothetical protein
LCLASLTQQLLQHLNIINKLRHTTEPNPPHCHCVLVAASLYLVVPRLPLVWLQRHASGESCISNLSPIVATLYSLLSMRMMRRTHSSQPITNMALGSWLMVAVAIMAAISVMSVEGSWTATVYTARLDGYQSYPTVGSETNIGIAVCVLGRSYTPMVCGVDLQPIDPERNNTTLLVHSNGDDHADYNYNLNRTRTSPEPIHHQDNMSS